METAGDCYIVSGGVLRQDGQGFYVAEAQHDPAASAQRVMAFAKDMLAAAGLVGGAGARCLVCLVMHMVW